MKLFSLALFLISFGLLHSQNEPASSNQLSALRIDHPIQLDGKLDEQGWNDAPFIHSFTQLRPYPGNPASKRTEVRVLYDDDALYISAHCFDDPDSVSQVLSIRDDYNPNLDVFQIYLDTYNDDQNGFYFGVTSRGVQIDAKIQGSNYIGELNLAWGSSVARSDFGWIAEIRIPYSAIRFPKTDVQTWGINFSRDISRYREESTWVKVNPDLENFLIENGELVGIQGIHPPLRLALMPYVSSYFDRVPKADGTFGWTRSFNGGMDIKYGVNEAFTLDVTLVPDFGQVVFDQQVLNLSPFEVQFNENRQFFTEGTELFNKAGLFYSRRIGIQAPTKVITTMLNPDEYLKNVPFGSKLYNATKFSGRLKNGLGIGVFNAVNAPQYGTAVNYDSGMEREVMISPLTNYNVFVLDQNLKNNSSVTFTNTSVLRSGEFYDANVSGLNFNANTKNNKFNFNGKTTVSVQQALSSKVGYNYNLNFGKQRGTWVYGVGYLEESDKFDPNDLGFNYNNNKRILEVSGAYRNFKPKWKELTKIIASASVSSMRLYAPNNYVGSYSNLGFILVSKSFNATGFGNNNTLTKNYDYFEPRVWGAYFLRPKTYNFSWWVSSNYQKRLAIDAGLNYNIVKRGNWKEYGYYFSPRIRFTDYLFFTYNWSQDFEMNSEGYAVAFDEPVNVPGGIIFGNRDRINSTQSVSMDYILTNRMGITFRLRHYRSSIQYHYFGTLNEQGLIDPVTSYEGLNSNGASAYNINYNAFTIDFQYRWVFQPSSEFNIVWKNSIFSSDKNVQDSYWSNLQNTFANGPVNSLSFKLIYWFDAGSAISKFKL
ncbi:MAG: DUF5916 domain-containing protein [Crocinitomicaceae bacterium]